MAKYWLMKSEPETFPIDQLAKEKTTWWEGVRNYQARNFMMNEMEPGDEVLFYHSNAEPPGIAGLAKVSKKAVADQTQFDKKSEYFDPKATLENPRWLCVELTFLKKFKNFIPLAEIKSTTPLSKMILLQKGSRLSIQPVTLAEFELIKKMGQ